MHVVERICATTLVQIVDVLSDDDNVTLVFGLKSRQCKVGGVGVHFGGLGAAGIVKIYHKFGIACESFWCGNVFDAVLCPQSVFGAEGFNAALGGNACAGKDDNFAHVEAPVKAIYPNVSYDRCMGSSGALVMCGDPAHSGGEYRESLMKIATAAYPLDVLTFWANYEDKIAAWVAEAAGEGTQLLVFPEYGAMELATLDGLDVAGDLERSLFAVSDRLADADA